MAAQLTTNGDSLANALGSTFTQSNASYSVSAWISAPWDGQNGSDSYIGLYNSLGGAGAIQIGARTAANICTIWTWGGGIAVESTAILVAQAWTHVTFTFDGTTARLYINGVLNASAVWTPAVIALNQVFINGYPTGGAGETATFQVDTYNFYNRTLTAPEILTMATCRGNRHGIINGCLLRYEFDEGAVGTEVISVPNQSMQVGVISNALVSNSVRTPRCLYSASMVSNNLRTPV